MATTCWRPLRGRGLSEAAAPVTRRPTTIKTLRSRYCRNLRTPASADSPLRRPLISKRSQPACRPRCPLLLLRRSLPRHRRLLRRRRPLRLHPTDRQPLLRCTMTPSTRAAKAPWAVPLPWTHPYTEEDPPNPVAITTT